MQPDYGGREITQRSQYFLEGEGQKKTSKTQNKQKRPQEPGDIPHRDKLHFTWELSPP